MNLIARIAITTGVATSAILGVQAAADASPDASTNPPLSATSSPAEADAVNYVDNSMGDTSLDGLCQALVRQAYESGGVDITTMASDNSSAVSFWNSTSLEKHPASTDIPAGALIYWGATSSNPDGHVALALGGDTAASTEERDNTGIHTFSISARNADGYNELGWVMPA